MGHLILSKGHGHIISALVDLPDVRLMIAGSGPERKKLELMAQNVGVSDRVTFLGPLPQESLRDFYGAADALILASSSEGWANVLLEAMACGTPVIASNVGGTSEVVRSPAAGVLMASATAQGVVFGVNQLRSHYPERAATRAYAERFSWDATTQGQLRLFREAARQILPAAALAPC